MAELLDAVVVPTALAGLCLLAFAFEGDLLVGEDFLALAGDGFFADFLVGDIFFAGEGFLALTGDALLAVEAAAAAADDVADAATAVPFSIL